MSERIGKFRLSDMKLDFVSLVAAGDDPMAQVVIAKAAPEVPDDPEVRMTEKVSKDDLDPTVVAYIDSLESEVEDLTKAAEEKDGEIADLKGTLSKMAPKDDEAAEEINKALLAKADPAVRALIEKQQADLKAQAEIAKAEREARLEREYVSKAESLPMLTEDKSDLGGLLRRLADALPEEDVKKWDTILKAANEQIAKGSLFDTFGTGGQPTTVSKSVEAQAQEIMKADPNLTFEQAQAKVYETNPALFAQAMKGE